MVLLLAQYNRGGSPEQRHRQPRRGDAGHTARGGGVSASKGDPRSLIGRRIPTTRGTLPAWDWGLSTSKRDAIFSQALHHSRWEFREEGYAPVSRKKVFATLV